MGQRNTLKIFGTIELHCAPVSLPFSPCLQCRNLYRISRTNLAMLLPTKSLSDPRQCIVSQRPGRMGVVLRPPQGSRGLQPSGVFARAQCIGEDMASHPSSWYPQSILCKSGRASLRLDFNVSEHPEKSISGYGLSEPVSTRNKHILSLYLYMDI